MTGQRRRHAEEDRLKFRNVVALRPLFHMVEIVEAAADFLAGLGDRQREFQARERPPRRSRRLLREFAERLQVAVARTQIFTEVAWDRGVDCLQIDNIVTIEHTEPRAAARLVTDNLQCVNAYSQPARRGRAADGLAQEGSKGKVRAPGE